MAEGRSTKSRPHCLSLVFLILFILVICGGLFTITFIKDKKLEDAARTTSGQMRVLSSQLAELSEKVKLTFSYILFNGTSASEAIKPIRQELQGDLSSLDKKLNLSIQKSNENVTLFEDVWKMAILALVVSAVSLIISIIMIVILCRWGKKKARSQP